MYLSLLLLPVVVLGQTSGITLSYDSAVASDTVSFGRGRCNTSQRVNYDAQLLTEPCTSLKFWVTDAKDCANGPSDTNLDWVFEVSQSDLVSLRKTGNFDVPLNDLPFFQRGEADGGVGCGVVDEKEHRVCGSIQVKTSFPLACPTDSSSFVKAGPALFLTYDNKPTDPPTLGEPDGLDSKISLTVSFPTDAVKVRLQMKQLVDGGDSDFQDQGELLVKPGATTVQNLTNGVTYAFRAYAYDAANNESDASATVEITPKRTFGFGDLCTEAGCPTGCSMVGFGPLSLVALLLVTAFRRLRR